MKLEQLQELAEMFARSQGWRPFDHLIELDLHIPWTFRDALHCEFRKQVALFIPSTQYAKELLESPDTPLRFKQVRTPNNILINLIDDENMFGFTLTKKETPEARPHLSELPRHWGDGDGAKVIPMFGRSDSAA